MEEFDERGSLSTGNISTSLADDLLHGADQIAEFLYGDEKERRKVYHLVEKSCLPHFRLGATLCARKSTLLQWIAAQEARAFRAKKR